jgi:predicted ArsR family transcriptional regulator
VSRGWGVTKGAVLAYLQQEADMDGLATVSTVEMGEALEVSPVAVGQHLRALVSEGLISHAGRTSGIKAHSISAYQLSEEVTS